MPCPQIFVKESEKSDFAFKECLPHGEWVQNADGIPWSNYTLCIKLIASFSEVNLTRTEYDEEFLNSTLTRVRKSFT